MGGPINTTARLANLRKAMQQHNVDVYIIPSEDAHASEYIADCDARRQWISGFTGSAGCAVVTHDKAALATDGRYFSQAAKELDANWTLLKQGVQDVPSWERWAADESAGGKVVGVDPTLLSSGVAKKLLDEIKKSGGSDLVSIPENLIDVCWDPEGKPTRPANPVVFLEDRFTGKGTKDKLDYLRKELEKKKSPGFVVSMLDEIAWLFNLRGSDIPYNPVFFSYALVTPNSATLYIDSAKLSDASQRYLSENNVEVKPYDAIFTDSEALASSTRITNGTTKVAIEQPKFLISNRTSWALQLALGGDDLVEDLRSPIGDAKAVKTETELEGMRQCHIRDGVALIKYFAWLEHQIGVEKAQMDEVQVADKLEELRKQQRDFVGLSFPTISSTGANAAIIHYKPARGDCAVLDSNAIYLCDSGAQYLDGTTDTTRTLHFGKPTDMEKKGYTLVLKGNMSLDMAIFPSGTTGFAIDVFARQFLWQEGLDYRHGTGHGVGSYLNVHEGPIGIGTRKHYVDYALTAGNVTSIEPGYYEDGSFGIRLENMALIKEIKTTHQFDDKTYLGFEHVTLVPFCRALIDESLLTQREKKWLNEYNQLVWDKTSGFLADDQLALEYLKRETKAF